MYADRMCLDIFSPSDSYDRFKNILEPENNKTSRSDSISHCMLDNNNIIIYKYK